jgi:hypothetical protein
MMQMASHYFSHSYAESRSRFETRARPLATHFQSYDIDARGRQGEALATDVALIGDPCAGRLLIVSSATHGVEGFCGSGCQLALLDDAPMLERARRAGVALLLVHAVNPHGFSWLARTDEGNIDLNRNAQPFDGGPLPVNAGYAGIHGLLLPEEWPPSRKNQQDLARYVAEAGLQAYAAAVTAGQHTHPDGLFYGGTGPAASLLNLRSILGEYVGTARTQVAWIDVYTGLGPRGHGEKIYAGKRDAAGVALARQWWGADLAVPFLGSSASADVTGYVGGLLHEACPAAGTAVISLEFGTVPLPDMVQALRGRNWLLAHPDADDSLRRDILQGTLDAFYCDASDWHGMVLGQSRVAVLQALCGLEAAR